MSSAHNPVIVAGGAVGKFGRFTDQGIAEITAPVLAATLQHAGVDASRIQVGFVGNAFGGTLHGQESVLGQILLKTVDIDGVPIHTIKNACSSGSDAVHLAWSAVAFGQVDCALALGAEKLTAEDRSATFKALATATDRVPTAPGRSVFMDVNAERAQRYMTAYGATARHFAMCAAKNRNHASMNERASVQERLSVEEVLEDKVVIEPLTRSMCGGICDGAAAVVLVSAKLASKLGLSGPRIVASAVATGVNNPSCENATSRAGALAYEQANIGPEEIDVAEVHDPTSPQELFDIEDLQLAKRGGAIALLEEGQTSLGGRLPVNTSGGLTARGHPVGATGVAQILEIAEQLNGQAGRRQVDGAKIGLAQMAGGLLGDDSAIATVHILER